MERERERETVPRSAQPYLDNVVLDILKGRTWVSNVMSAPSEQKPINHIIMISKHSSALDELRKRRTYPHDEFNSARNTSHMGRRCWRIRTNTYTIVHGFCIIRVAYDRGMCTYTHTYTFVYHYKNIIIISRKAQRVPIYKDRIYIPYSFKTNLISFFFTIIQCRKYKVLRTCQSIW